MKIAAYVRVSTERQADEGLGLDVQEHAIRAWAKANGHRVVAVVRDEGVSGTKELDDRPGLADAFDLVKSGAVQGVCVYRLDRLARDLVLQEQLLAEVRRLGGEVFSTSAAEAGFLKDDPDDPSRKLIRQILGAVSEYERSMIALRLRSGRYRKAQQGRYAFGAPPYGYKAERGELVADESAQAVLVRVGELHRSGASLRDIAATLTTEGHRPPRGDRWHPNTVSRLVARSTPGSVQ